MFDNTNFGQHNLRNLCTTQIFEQHYFWTTQFWDNTILGKHNFFYDTTFGQRNFGKTQWLDNKTLGQHNFWRKQFFENAHFRQQNLLTTQFLDNTILGQAGAELCQAQAQLC